MEGDPISFLFQTQNEVRISMKLFYKQLACRKKPFQENYKTNQDEGGKDPKTMNKHTPPWNKSCKISVLPKIGI